MTINNKRINRGYNGDERLRRAGTVIDLEQWQLDEIRKCRNDYIYFIENYFYIQTLDEGDILFKMWDCQKEFLHTIHKNRRIIGMQSRQTGKSSCSSAYILWKCLFKRKRKEEIAILANKAASAREVIYRIQHAMLRLPKWLQQGVRVFNKGSIELESGAIIFSGATTKQGIRGRSCLTGDTRITLMQPNGLIFNSRIDSLPKHNSNLKVLTGVGFRHFEGLLDQGVSDTIIKLNFFGGNNIRSTKDHKFRVDGVVDWIECENLKVGDSLTGFTIQSIEYLPGEQVYDIYQVEEVNSFIANGMVVSNCSMIYIDEAAIVENSIADDFFTAIQPVISSGKNTKILLTSTPLGYNHFYHRWQAATKWDTGEKGTNGFVQFFIHWSQIPGRTQEWADAERKAIGDLKFNQEYDCKFLGSSLTLLDPNIIGSLKASTPIIENQEGLRIFTPPVQMVRDSNGKVTQVPHLYFGIVDVSRGIGGDYSALTIIDVSVNPYKVVATYRNNLVSPLLFPTIIAKLGYDYNEAFLLVEINENGQQIADILYDELEYENLLTVVKNGTRGQVLSSGFGRNTGCQIGVKTSTTVKRLGCLAIKTLIEEHKLSPEDSNIINEFTTFIQVRKSYEADQGYHDDMVMTLVLFGWLTTQQFFKDLTNEDLRDSIFKNRITSINQNLTPYIFVSQKEPEVIVEDYGNRMYIEETTDIDDIRWLLGM